MYRVGFSSSGYTPQNSYMLLRSQNRSKPILSNPPVTLDPIDPNYLTYTKPKQQNHRPNCLFSNVLNSPKLTALNAKANSKPTSPPYAGSPILLPMGPMNHTCDMPITAPKTPKQKASTAAMPGGRRPGLFQMEMSYLRCLKTKCSVREMPS